MADALSGGFTQEFLEEAREHLSSIHEHLLALEESLIHTGEGANVSRHESVEQLFRSFHTLKGLSGMIGLQPAAELSHQLESILLAVQKARIRVTQDVIQALFEGVEKLESVIATLAEPHSMEISVADEVERLSNLLPEPSQKVAVEASPEQPSAPTISIDSFLSDILKPYPDIRGNLNENDFPALLNAILKGRYLSLCTFLPSAEYTTQGINVASIREKLKGIGELIKAIPLVSGSLVRFAFLTATEHPVDFQEFSYLECVTLLPGREETTGIVEADAPQAAALMTGGTGRIGQTNLVRVDMNRLDDLVQMVGELVIQRSVVAEKVKSLTSATAVEQRELAQTMGQMDRTLRRLRDAVLHTRMVPLSEVFSQMPLAVRDLARATGKEVQLIMEGADTEIDKVLVDRLFDPLLHLVRNAVTHGLERPGERSAAGKPVRGRLTLSGKPEGDHILVEVRDDGRGIDRSKVEERAAEMGWILPNQEISDSELLDLLCRPGFSTQDAADLGSGRGVGMDVVKRTVAAMNGSLSLTTEPGEGTTFTLRLPLSLVILDAVLVRSENEIYAIPQGLLDEVIQIELDQIVQAESGELYPFRGNALVVFRLSHLFDLRPVEDERYSRAYRYGLIGSLGDQRTVLMVDQLIGLREIVVRPVSDPLVACAGITGATELGNGQVVLILNPNDLLEDTKGKRI